MVKICEVWVVSPMTKGEVRKTKTQDDGDYGYDAVDDARRDVMKIM